MTDPKNSHRRLTAAGLMWALAANTRVNLALAIFFLAAMVLLKLLQKTGQTNHAALAVAARWRAALSSAAFWRPALHFGLPLLLGAGLLMAYNAARFDGPLDFGYRYLITGPTIPEDPTRVSSPDYVIPNLYTYFLRPPELQTEFPYVFVPWIKADTWPFFIDLPPDYYYTEPVASLLLTVPLIGLGAFAVLRTLWLGWNGHPPSSIDDDDEERALVNWLLISLAGATFLAAVVLLFFVQNSYRYIVDATLLGMQFSMLFIARLRYSTGGPSLGSPALGLRMDDCGRTHSGFGRTDCHHRVRPQLRKAQSRSTA